MLLCKSPKSCFHLFRTKAMRSYLFVTEILGMLSYFREGFNLDF